MNQDEFAQSCGERDAADAHEAAVAYNKQAKMAQRHKILDDLTQAEREQGLYDRVPDDFNAMEAE